MLIFNQCNCYEYFIKKKKKKTGQMLNQSECMDKNSTVTHRNQNAWSPQN